MKNKGFAVVEIIIVAVVVVVLAGVGYKYYANRHQVVPTPSLSSAEVPAAPEIKSTTDLTAAKQALDQIDLSAGNSDSSQLDSLLSQF